MHCRFAFRFFFLILRTSICGVKKVMKFFADSIRLKFRTFSIRRSMEKKGERKKKHQHSLIAHANTSSERERKIGSPFLKRFTECGNFSSNSSFRMLFVNVIELYLSRSLSRCRCRCARLSPLCSFFISRFMQRCESI